MHLLAYLDPALPSRVLRSGLDLQEALTSAAWRSQDNLVCHFCPHLLPAAAVLTKRVGQQTQRLSYLSEEHVSHCGHQCSRPQQRHLSSSLPHASND